MTSLPAVPHSLPPRAGLAPRALAARSCPLLPARRPPRRLARSSARPLARPPARPDSREGGGFCLPGSWGPSPEPRGARCPRGAGRIHGAPEAPTGRLRGDPGQWPRATGRRDWSPPPPRRPRPRLPASPPRRFPLLSRPPPPAAAPRAPPAKLSLSSPLSPPGPPASAAGGRDWDFLRSPGRGRGPPAADGPGQRGGGSERAPWPGGGDPHLGGKGATQERPGVQG